MENDDTLDDMLRWARLKCLSEEELANLEWALEVKEVPGLVGMRVIEAAFLAGVVASKGEARRFIINGGLALNFRTVMGQTQEITASDLVRGRVLLRAGNNHGILREGVIP